MGRGQDLLDAARKGDERSVEKILSQINKRSGPFTSILRPANVNVTDDNGYTPLHHACLQGHKGIVYLLLTMGALPDVADKKGATPLHLAAWKGDHEIVRMLLEHNNQPGFVNQVTQDNETALIMAAQFGFVKVVKQLIEQGADVNVRNFRDESALDLAAQYGRLQTVVYLIKVHPNLVHPYKRGHWRNFKYTSTPLHGASKNGHEDVVLVLLQAGIDPNICTNSGTPLHDAACFGKDAVVRTLLENGADLKAVDAKNKTVEDLLADYSEKATKKVRRVIHEYIRYRNSRHNYESEEDLPPFPVHDCSPLGYPPDSETKAPTTQKSINLSESLLTPSSSFLTKNSHQSFVKKLASKCLGLKAKFNSAPNISNTIGLESNVDNNIKRTDSRINSNALHIGNSKFFKILSKKEESGDIVCNDEFDTISLDRLGTLNRDSAVNRSNRSCPGFKTSLPNISENNEICDEGIEKSDAKDSTFSNNTAKLTSSELTSQSVTNEAINFQLKFNIFEPRENKSNRISLTSIESANLVNECYESYEFSLSNSELPDIAIDTQNKMSSPKPTPRSKISIEQHANARQITIYENLPLEKQLPVKPTPAARTHIPTKTQNENCSDNINIIDQHKTVYENVVLLNNIPEPIKRSLNTLNAVSTHSSPTSSRSSSLSSDSMIDESNLEDILLSEKSRSFRHGKKLLLHKNSVKSDIHRTQSSESNFTDITGTSAIENVDCSDDMNENSIYLSMSGTLPTKKQKKSEKKVLFRHKTFTNIEVDRNSLNIPSRNNSFLKETLAHYHIRGTGHCIYQAPTVQEFIYIFNRETLFTDAEPFTKVPTSNQRDSYFETAICFCKPQPPKHHNSAEDLLDISAQEEDAKVSIDINALRNNMEMISTSFQCFCDSGICTLHANKRAVSADLVVKFSAVKRSISTPDITLAHSSSFTVQKSRMVKNKSVPSNLEEPYAVVTVSDIIKRKESRFNKVDLESPGYVQISPHSSLSSNDRPYSIKDISDVISLGSNIGTLLKTFDTNPSSCVSNSPQVSLRKSSSEHSGHWSLQSCNSNSTVISDTSFKTCLEGSSDDGSDATLHSDGESSDADTIKSDVSTTKRPWIHSSSFRYGNRNMVDNDSVIEEEPLIPKSNSPKFESGISVQSSETSSSECEDDSGVPRDDADVSLNASLERVSGMVGSVRSGSGRRRWDEAEGTSEGDALSISSTTSSCAPLHLAHRHDYNKVSPTPPKKPPRRNLSVSPTHVNSPSSGYSYELRTHARSQDDLDDIQGAKHYLKHGRSIDQYVDGKLSEYEENHNSPRTKPVPKPRPSLKNRTQPVAITAMYENVVIKEQNPRRKLRRSNLGPQYENFETRMTDKRVRKYSNQEKSSLESLLDDQSVNSPSDCERYSDGSRLDIPLSPTHYEQPPTPDHPPPSAKQAENSIHERIRPLSQLIMEVVEEIRIRKKSQGDVPNT